MVVLSACMNVGSLANREAKFEGQVARHLLRTVTSRCRAAILAEIDGQPGAIHDRLRLAIRTQEQLRRRTPGVHLHAAACRLPSGKTLLLPGPSGCGKSTLTGELSIRVGAGIIADDSVVIRGRSAAGLGGPISVRASSPLWPNAQRLWYACAGDRMLVHPSDLGGQLVPAAQVDAVVFPAYGDTPSMLPLSAGQAFARLVSMLLAPASDDRLLELANTVAILPRFAAQYSTTTEAIELIGLLFELHMAVGQSAAERLTSDELRAATAPLWGIRFGHEVVLFNRASNQVVLLDGWQPSDAPDLSSWSRLVGLARDRK